MSGKVLFGMIDNDTATSIALALSIVSIVWLLINTFVFGFAIAGKQDSFSSGLRSETAKGVLSSAPSLRFQPRTDTGSSSGLALGGGDSIASFLGVPEPPTFYDIGDINDTRAAIGETMGRAQSRSANEASSASGFSNLDDQLIRLG